MGYILSNIYYRSMIFYSHTKPNIILQEHLKYVGCRSKKIIESKVFNNIDVNVISDISELIGLCHDFGKYTLFFQDKLNFLIDANNPLTYHSLLSALFTFDVINEYLKVKKLTNDKRYKFLPFIAYFVVKHHHVNLKDIESSIRSKDLFKQFKHIAEQIKSIEKNECQIKKEYYDLIECYGISVDKIFDSLKKYKTKVEHIDDIKPLIKQIQTQCHLFIKDKKRSMLPHILTELLFSTLIDSDKKHAGRVREIERVEIPETLVEDYINSKAFQKKNKGKLDKIKNGTRKSALKNIIKDIKQRIFTLTVITGGGKTLTGFSVALLLRKKMKKELGLKYEPRIIYALPFMSIIEQNYSRFEEVLSQIKDFKKNKSKYLLGHHHLSEAVYKTEGINEEDVEESLALIESWESEVVVTTFIQLFYTLIGYKNRSLKKFHNITNSIIILDEVQNIPIKYWELVQEVLVAMTKYFNCRIILMTATKPLIFDEGTYKELVDDYKSYFKSSDLNRVCLKIHHEKITIKNFCDGLTDWSKNSYLFVLNTIDSSLKVYKAIKDKKLDFEIFHLSSDVLPFNRKIILKKIEKALEQNKKIIIVSTQLIEAGVDIDCECGYRDMGPLDSIIQFIGRIGRNKNFGMGEAHLLNLVNENMIPFTGIYDPVLIDTTRDILKNKKRVYEKDFLELIDKYFQEVKHESSVSTKLKSAIYNLYFDEYENFDKNKKLPISKFELIEEQPYKVNVFVKINSEAEALWNKYEKIYNNKELMGYEKKNKFLKIKSKFYAYVISVNRKKVGVINVETPFIPITKEWYESHIYSMELDDDSATVL